MVIPVVNPDSSIFLYMFLTVSLLLIAWLAKFHWKRRDLYRKAAKIPGPRGYPLLGKALDFYGSSNAVIMEAGIRLFKTNPPIFKIWLGPKLLAGVSRPEHLEIVLNHPKCLRKDNVYRFMKEYGGQGLISAPVRIWKVHRKLINPTFNQKILDSFFEVFNEQSKILTSVLAEKLHDEHFDILKIMSSFSVDVICETAMGTKANSQTTTNNYGSWLDKWMAIVVIRMMTVYYQSDWIFKWSKHQQIRDDVVAKLNDYTRQVVHEKKKQFEEKRRQSKNGDVIEESAKRKCFLDHLLELSDEKTSLSEDELKDEVNTFMSAGSDTNATSLCLFLMILGMNPDIQKKVYDEIIDVLGYDRDVTLEDLSKLQFLERCMKEAMRILPPVPFIIRSPTADIEVGGFLLPANCSIFISIVETHRSEKYWKDPFKFDPDRFLPEEVAKRHPYSFIPFSGGSRMCIGYKFARMVMKTALATLIRKFVVKTEYKTVEEIELAVHIVVRPTQGFKVSLEPRK